MRKFLDKIFFWGGKITITYCFAIIPLLIFGIFKDKIPRIISVALTVIAVVIFVPISMEQPFETYSVLSEDIVFTSRPQVTSWSGEGGRGDTEVVNNEAPYSIKISGDKRGKYSFTLSDDGGNSYDFEYYYDGTSKSVVVRRMEQ
ncbi:hypothetical protein IJH74_02390 [Candidatus Saccharibacteria bacterium]|nr:hypothetical protein [Candidatus Saccharibacteria bacterium]